MPRSTKAQSNVEFVTDIMEFSNYGALSQMFVIEALRNWSERVAAADPTKMETGFISGAAWVGVAKEIKAKLEEKY